MKNYIEVVMEEKERMTPKEGFNIVIFDDFGRPGEMLELVAHADTLEEAERIKQALKGDVIYIYGVENETNKHRT